MFIVICVIALVIGIYIAVNNENTITLMNRHNEEGVMFTMRTFHYTSDLDLTMNVIYKFFDNNRDRAVLVDLKFHREPYGPNWIKIWYKKLVDEDVRLPF